MSDNGPELTIAPPRPDRPPLHNNLFNCMQKGNANLTLLFPYLHRGAMVAAGALFIGGPDRSYGHFYHHNSVDEVITNFTSNGAMLQPGQVYCGGRRHGVNSFLKDEKNADNFALMSVVQRQTDDGTPQTEGISVHCEKCRHQLFFEEFDASPGDESTDRTHPFPSVACLPPIFDKFNADVGMRTCPECGTVNEPFPISSWGWEEYRLKTEVMIRAGEAHADGPAAAAG